MVAAKKTTVVAKKPVVKTPPKPKFGEVGFKFPVMATIVEVNDEDEYNYPFVVEINGVSFDDLDYNSGVITLNYNSKQFKEFYASCDPKFVKVQKQEQLKQAQEKVKEAQALVAKITKELSELK